MSWDEIMASLRNEAHASERETCSYIADENDLQKWYGVYLKEHAQNEVILAFVEKIRGIDEKLDKILEKSS